MKMEHSPTRLMKNLTIEARHTLSLEESKKKRQQFENSLFLPNNKKRKDVLKIFDRKPHQTNMDSSQSNELKAQLSSNESDNSLPDHSAASGKDSKEDVDGDKKDSSAPMNSASSYSSLKTAERSEKHPKSSTSVNKKKSRVNKKFKTFVRKSSQLQNPYPSFVAFRTKGNKGKQDKSNQKTTIEPTMSKKHDERQGESKSIAEKTDEKEELTPKTKTSQTSSSVFIDLTQSLPSLSVQSEGKSNDDPCEEVQIKTEDNSIKLLRATSPEPFLCNSPLKISVGIGTSCQGDKVQSPTHKTITTTSASIKENLLPDQVDVDVADGDASSNQQKHNLPLRIPEVPNFKKYLGPKYKKSDEKVVYIDQQQPDINSSDTAPLSGPMTVQQSSFDSTIHRAPAQAIQEEMILQEVPSSSIPFQPFYLQRPQVYGGFIAPSADLGRPCPEHQSYPAPIAAYNTQAFMQSAEPMQVDSSEQWFQRQPLYCPVQEYSNHAIQPQPTQMNETFPTIQHIPVARKMPISQITVKYNYVPQPEGNNNIQRHNPSLANNTQSLTVPQQFLCHAQVPAEPSPGSRKNSSKKPRTKPAKPNTTQYSQTPAQVVTPTCISHPFNKTQQHPPSNIQQYPSPINYQTQGYGNQHRFDLYPTNQHRTMSPDRSQFGPAPSTAGQTTFHDCNTPRSQAPYSYRTHHQSYIPSFNQAPQNHPNSADIQQQFEKHSHNSQSLQSPKPANSEMMRQHFNQHLISYWDQHKPPVQSTSSVHMPQHRIPAHGPVDPEQWFQARLKNILETVDKHKTNTVQQLRSRANQSGPNPLAQQAAVLIPEFQEKIMEVERVLESLKNFVSKVNNFTDPLNNHQQVEANNNNAPRRANVNVERVEPDSGIAWGPNCPGNSREIDRGPVYQQRDNPSSDTDPRMDVNPVNQPPTRQQIYSHQIIAADSTTGGSHHHQFFPSNTPHFQHHNQQIRSNFYEYHNNHYNGY